jgi:hypothetical protein
MCRDVPQHHIQHIFKQQSNYGGIVMPPMTTSELKAGLDELYAGIIITDIDCHIVYANDSAVRIISTEIVALISTPCVRGYRAQTRRGAELPGVVCGGWFGSFFISPT